MTFKHHLIKTEDPSLEKLFSAQLQLLKRSWVKK